MYPIVEETPDVYVQTVKTRRTYPEGTSQTYKVREIEEPTIYEPIPVTTTTENELDNYVDFNNSSTFIEAIRQRVKYVFEPLFSTSSSQSVDTRTKYRPRLGLKRKDIYKPKRYNKYLLNNDYQPQYTQVSLEDFSPKNRDVLSYKPDVNQEAYPVFTYSTFGIPDTYVDEYAPQETVRIKPVTDFEIRAKPKPLIVSQAHLILLGRLLGEVL